MARSFYPVDYEGSTVYSPTYMDTGGGANNDTVPGYQPKLSGLMLDEKGRHTDVSSHGNLLASKYIR